MKALVIGGTRGFGKEISNNLINKGVNLISVSRAKKGCVGQLHYTCDISDLASWKRTINKIMKENKEINLIFFIFGFADPNPFTKLSVKDWSDTFSRNVVYVAMLLQNIEDSPLGYDGIKIVTIGSQWSYKVGNKYLVPYIVSKHALKILTDDFAKRNRSMIVNHICVPTMNTPGYHVIRRSFERIGTNNLVKGIVSDHQKIAKKLVQLVLDNNKSGVSFIITPKGKVNRLLEAFS